MPVWKWNRKIFYSEGLEINLVAEVYLAEKRVNEQGEHYSE